MATTTFREATKGTYAGYETSFTLREVKILAALCGNVVVEAVEGVVGGSWSGDGWQQISAIEFVDGTLRFPACIANRSHRILRLAWNPETGHLDAFCQITDARGRLLNGHRKLVRDPDGQTSRACGANMEFANGNWRQAGPIDCDAISAEWVKRTEI